MKQTTKNSKLKTILATDLENQHAYVEQLSKQGERGYALIAASTFVQGMRDSGYKSTGTAIDEFVDNSYQAGANRVDVVYVSDKSRMVTGVAVIDDGHGMEPEMIRAAVLWGGTHRFNDRSGYGRYGFGLPSAAVSISKEYEVYSKIEGGSWYRIKISLEEIAQGKLTNRSGLILAPEPTKASLPEFVTKALAGRDLKSGTVINLIEPDRLTAGFRKSTTFEQKMLEHLGLVYRGILRLCDIRVNGTKVMPVDPLFLDPNARYYDVNNEFKAEALPGNEFKFANRLGQEGTVRLRYSYMHPHFQKAQDGGLDKARFGVMKDNNSYLIVTRAGRQIDLVMRPHYTNPKDNITIINFDRNWAVELDFDPVLDEEFGITVNKQQVTLSEAIWQKLCDEKLPVIIKSLRSRFKKDKNDLGEAEGGDQPRESEQVMDEASKFARPMSKPSDRKQEQARKNIEAEAKRKASQTQEPEEQVLEGLLAEYSERKFAMDFESLEGAPFYRAEQYGPQIRVWINRRHRFYTDLFVSSEANPRVRTALELLLFVFATCELESEGDREIFYQVERAEWSRRLETTLALLDRKQSVEDSDSATAEDEETAPSTLEAVANS
jgi:hypothetical protein